MPSDRPDLTALIGSRICHDLISPLGAISNGVELLSMTGLGGGPELDLINESVANANARIRFFRVAFGAASEDQRIGRPEILGIIGDLTRGGRLRISWQAEGDQARREVKLVFLMLQCLESAMPYGGDITVTRAEAHWTLRAEARKLKIDPVWDVLIDRTAVPDISPAQVHFALVPIELQRQNRHLRSDLGETGIVMRF